MRALPAAVALAGQARARKHDRDLGNRLAGQAAGLLGRDAVLTVIALQDAGKLPDWGVPAREQVTGLAGAVYDEGFWSRVDAWAGQLGLTGPAGIVQASDVPGLGVAWPAAGGRRGEEDEQA